VRKIAANHHLRWEPISNSTVLRQLGKGYTYYYTTWGMCDCSTELGSHLRLEQGQKKVDPERKIKGFRKEGWSEVKIARWLADQSAVADRKKLHREAKKRIEGPEVKGWIEFASEVLTGRQAKSLGVLLHFYSGSIDSERIHFSEHRRIQLAALTKDVLYSLPDDVFLEVLKSAKAASA
jgi:hypothetical protein